MNNYFDLENKNILITGANGGVGSACARIFALTAKSNVILLARSDCSKLVDEIKSQGGSASFYSTDLLDPENIKESMSKIKNDFASINALLNIAGHCDFFGSQDTARDKVKFNDKRWEHIISINGKAVVDMIDQTIELMPNGSSIVNISSSAAKYGAEMAVSEYSFAKAGIIGLSLSYAKILAPLGIRINCVAPGPIEGTNMLEQCKDLSLELYC